MDKGKKITQHYQTTGILGAYESAECVDDIEMDGQFAPCFDDSLIIYDSDVMRTSRRMMVGGKAFRISSIFPVIGVSTPTERMLRLIDADLEKESRND